MASKQTTATLRVFTQSKQPFDKRELILPRTSDGEIQVKIDLCTICGSDLHTIHGRRAAHGPSVLGHEIIGRIVELPATPICDHAGQTLQIGDRVTWSIHASCGKCFYCQQNLTAKCEELFKYGHEPISDRYPSTGGFGTHCQLLPGTTIVRVPDSLSDRIACPSNCATATVAAAFRVAGDCQNQCVLILGAGMLGLTATAMANELGAANVIVVDPNEDRANLSVAFGATSIAHSLAAAQQEVKLATDGRGADLAFDFTGVNDAVLAAIHFLRIGGRAVLVGSVSPTESIAINPEFVVRRWLQINGVHNYVAEDLVTAVQFLERCHAKYPFEDMVAATYRLDDIQQAIEHASSGRAIRIGVHE